MSITCSISVLKNNRKCQCACLLKCIRHAKVSFLYKMTYINIFVSFHRIFAICFILSWIDNPPTPTPPVYTCICHDDVIKWKHFPRNWPFVRGIHRSPVNSPHKSQWHGALIFSLICVWVNNCEAGDLRRHRGHYAVIVIVKEWNVSHDPWILQ